MTDARNMRKIMETVEREWRIDERHAPDDVKSELAELIELAKVADLNKAADYIEHVLNSDYDSLDYFDDKGGFDPNDPSLPMMLRRQAESKE